MDDPQVKHYGKAAEAMVEDLVYGMLGDEMTAAQQRQVLTVLVDEAECRLRRLRRAEEEVGK